MSAKKAAQAGEESADYESDNVAEGDNGQTMQYLLNSPAYMSGVMRRHLLTEMFKKLPLPVQARVHALKNLQLDHTKLEAKFYEEVYVLERKYQLLYQPLQDKRAQILAGEHEPSTAEATPKPGTESSAHADEAELGGKLDDVTAEIRKHLKQQYPNNVSGVPDFWLTIFRSTELMSTMIQSHDEAVLKLLRDVRVVYADDMSYTLEFQFSANEWFSNAVLTKTYYLKSKVDAEEPFSFEGPEIYRCTGCTIDWLPGKNLTVKTIKKKQKHKARGAVRTVNKQVPADSFFNFFNPPAEPEDEEEADEDTESILATDYEIGHFLRARVIPKAVLYYTGDLVDEEEDEDFDEEEEEEEDSEEDDDDDDAPAARGKGGQGGQGKGGKENPAECKQQ